MQRPSWAAMHACFLKDSKCKPTCRRTDAIHIEGTYRGEMKFEIVQTGTMNAQIRW